MPTQRHRTVIEIDVDDRKIRGLDRTMHRAFDDQMLASFERMLERTARTVETMTAAAEKFAAAMEQGGRSGGGGGGGGGSRVPPSSGGGSGGGRGDSGVAAAIAALNRNLQQIQNQQRQQQSPGFWKRAGASAVGTYLGGLGARAGSGEGFFSQAVGGIPIFGGFVQGALNSMHRFAGMHAMAQTQMSRQAGTLGRSSALGEFTRFGLAAPEAYQQAASFAQMAGRSGAGADRGLMNGALAMQMLGGISEAPGVVRASEIGGASVDGTTQMFQAVSAGIRAGIRDARLGQFVGVATQVLEQSRLEGTNTQLGQVLRTFTGLSGLGDGFTGEQAQRAGMQAISSLRNFAPNADVASLVALRSTGFGSEGGPSYHEALRSFQERPAEVMPRLLESIRGMAPGNRTAQIELMRQIAPRLLGFTPTIQQAESMVGGDLGVFGQEVGMGDAQDFLRRRQGEIGGMFGVASREAGYRNRQLDVGSRVYGTSRTIQSAEMTMTETVLPRVAEGIEGILTWLQEAWSTFSTEGFGAVITEAISGAMRSAFEGDFAGIREALTAPEVGESAATMHGVAQYTVNEMARRASAAVLGEDSAVTRRLGQSAIEGLVDATEGEIGAGRRDTRRGVRGPVTPGPTVPETGAGPESNAADAVRRARDALDAAATHLDRLGMPQEGQVAVG